MNVAEWDARARKNPSSIIVAVLCSCGRKLEGCICPQPCTFCEETEEETFDGVYSILKSHGLEDSTLMWMDGSRDINEQ